MSLQLSSEIKETLCICGNIDDCVCIYPICVLFVFCTVTTVFWIMTK